MRIFFNLIDEAACRTENAGYWVCLILLASIGYHRSGKKWSLIPQEIQSKKEPQMQVYWAWHQPIFWCCTTLKKSETIRWQVEHFLNCMRKKEMLNIQAWDERNANTILERDLIFRPLTWPIPTAYLTLTFPILYALPSQFDPCQFHSLKHYVAKKKRHQRCR